MKPLLGILVGLICIAAIAVAIDRVRSNHEQVAAQPAAVVAANTHTEEPLGNAVTDYGPLTISGTAIMDDSSGLPAVPYIKYVGQNGSIWTKQLIFTDPRGCAPSAADIPCVPGYPQTAAYPQIVTGEHITVEGYIRDNRFLVVHMSVDG